MALIQCPECKTEVSEKALSCPKCGHPLNTDSGKKTGNSLVGILGGTLVVIGLLTVGYVGWNYLHKPQPPKVVVKPLLPVEVKYRKALLANGYVAVFINRSDRELGVLATFENPTFKSSKSFRLNLNPGTPVQFGHLQGWNFESGDKITLKENDFQTWSSTFP